MTLAAILAKHFDEVGPTVPSVSHANQPCGIKHGSAVPLVPAVPVLLAVPSLVAHQEQTPEQIRAQLLAVAPQMARPSIEAMTLDDLSECVALPIAALGAYASALGRSALMGQGVRPPEYTNNVVCKGCGPVWLWEGAPPVIEACPWCFHRMAGRSFPRP